MSSEIPLDCTVKLLLVDDEENITKALRRLLVSTDQYEILIANSGADALSLLKKEKDIGVIISDQRMPQMTGVEFLSQARLLTPEAIRILLTGYADIQASIGAINEGAVFRYLTKPWDEDELLKVVGEGARNYWLVAENKRLNELVAKQTAELQDWNARLKQRVLEQTSQIRAKSVALAETNVQLRNSFNETIEAIAGLSEMRDRRAPAHSRNVAELVTAMAKMLEIPREDQEKVRSAGLLHDIGKIGMPDRLFVKSVKSLDHIELMKYQEHAVRGQAAIDKVPALRDLGILIRHHHERFDGRGFPDRLNRDAIPFGSRLICAADMLERMLIKYPSSVALESALAEIAQEWGKSLDPSLRLVLEEGAREVYSYLDISAEIYEAKVSPKNLTIGMQLRQDLYSGTGVLLLKKGSIFSESSIDAVKRCFMIDPFEREIAVLIKNSPEDG